MENLSWTYRDFAHIAMSPEPHFPTRVLLRTSLFHRNWFWLNCFNLEHLSGTRYLFYSNEMSMERYQPNQLLNHFFCQTRTEWQTKNPSLLTEDKT